MNIEKWYFSLLFFGLLGGFSWFCKYKLPQEDFPLMRWLFTIGFFIMLIIPLGFKDNPIWLWLGIKFN